MTLYNIENNIFSIKKWKIEVYTKALEKWGKPLQIIMGIEEMSELTKELTKYLRGNNERRNKLIEEIADVSIMLEQLILIFDCQNEFEIKKSEKFLRLDEMLKQIKGNNENNA